MQLLFFVLGLFLSIKVVFSASFLVERCTGRTFYHSPSLSCVPCPVLTEPNNWTANAHGSPSTCSCSAGYYASSSGTCLACPSGTVSKKDRSGCIACGSTTLGISSNECVCANSTKFALVETEQTGFALSRKECIRCPNGTRVFLAPVTVSSTLVRPLDPYSCQSCGDINAILDADGTCSCASGFVNPSVTFLSNGLTKCISNADILSAFSVSTVAGGSAGPSAASYQVNFYNIQSSATGSATGTQVGKASLYFQHNLITAAVGCFKYKVGGDSEPCQSLANLCVLQLYDSSTAACSLFAGILQQTSGSGGSSVGGGIHGYASWPTSQPFLLWGVSLASLLVDTSLQRSMAFKSGVSGTSRSLSFYLASYSINGTFRGLERLRSQFLICSGGAGGQATSSSAASQTDDISIDPLWGNFGNTQSSSYLCDVRIIASSTAPPLFYELYVRDLGVDSAASDKAEAPGLSTLPMQLLPVPVRIVNYRASDGTRPNMNTNNAAESDDVFVNRFFLVDTASGLSNPGSLPDVARYAARINLLIKSQTEIPSRITYPILTVEYHERLTSVLTGPMAFDTLRIEVEYTGDSPGYTSSFIVLAFVLLGASLIWSCLRFTGWRRMNSRSFIEATVTWDQMVLYALYVVNAAALFFFWFLFIACAYWLCYFKLAETVYILLPLSRPLYSDNYYSWYFVALWLIWIAYIVRVLHAVLRQLQTDIFFIDWEKSNGALFKTGQDFELGLARQQVQKQLGGASSDGLTQHKFAPVSAWRTIFAAHEWIKLTTMRRSNAGLTFTFLIALLEGAQLKNVATTRQGVSDLSNGTLNPMIQFANTVFWFFIALGCQYIFLFLLGERYLGENPIRAFIDRCTVMKISVLMVDQKYHAYYIHANAPHEHADGTMQDISNQLFEEAAATRTGRGLPGSPNQSCQVFEVHVPAIWRDRYDRVYKSIKQLSNFGGSSLFGSSTPPPSTLGQGGGGLSLSSESKLQKQQQEQQVVAAARSFMTNFLQGFVEESDPDLKRAWRERTVFEALFDLPPDLVSESAMAAASGITSSVASFYLDMSYRFSKIVFSGIEYDLCIIDILTFCLIQQYSSPSVAGVITYILGCVLAWARKLYGNKRIAETALIDERFL
jgi:meckelin